MKIETQTREDHQVNLIVELDADMQNKYMRRAARKISESGRIPGFRPGKAPYDVVKRTYGDESIQEQAIDLLLEDIYPQALDEAGIDPSGPGKLNEAPSMNPPKFNFVIPLKPVITLCDYHAVRQDYHLEPASDEQVNRTLRRMQINNAIAETVDRPAQINDMVAGTFDASYLKPVEGEEKPIFSNQPFEILIEENESEDYAYPFPGFSRELIGLSVNGEKKVLHTYSEETSSEKLRGKEVEFSITIQSIKELELASLDDEFAKTIGEYKSITELTNAIREQIDQYNRQSYDDEYFSRLFDTLLEQSTVKYPPHMLDEEIEHVLKSVERNLAYQRMDLSAYLKSINMEKDKYIENEIKPNAIKLLQRSLIMQEIIRLEKITIDRDELQNATAKTIGNLSDIPASNLPRGKTREDYLMAATFETANALLSQHLKDRLKAIASGEFNKETQEEDASKTEIKTPETSSLDTDVSQTPPKKVVKRKKKVDSLTNIESSD